MIELGLAAVIEDDTAPGPTPTEGSTHAIGWQEAVARLAGERTRAETAVALLKKHGDRATISRGENAYSNAKANFDEIIVGLIVALARDDRPTSVPELEARLQQAVASREAFGMLVRQVVPDRTGERDLIVDLIAVSETLGPLVAAATVLWLRARDGDRLTRKTIETQLEAARWRDFAVIPAAA